MGWMLAALAVLLGVQIFLWPHITDDAYITFRYALNLANGNGLAFNPGERVEGFSNPLWTLLLSGLHILTQIDLPDLARSAGLLFAVGTVVCGIWILRKTAGRVSNEPVIFFLLFIILNPGFHVYATAGLEGPLLAFLLTAGTALSLVPTSRTQFSAALLLGFAGITRPEGPLYALLWFLATLRPPFNVRGVWRNEAPRFLLMLLPIVAWHAFRFLFYGSLLPNTALAKIPGVFGEFIDFPEYVTPWLVAAGGPMVLLLWFVLPPRDESVRLVERIALVLTGANLIFVAYARGDWMTFGRFIVPVWPVVAIGLSLWMSSILTQLRESPSLRFRRALPFLPPAGIAFCALLAWYPSIEKYATNEGMNMLMRGTDQLAVGEWIDRNIAPDATIATGRLGGISYGAMENVVWDWFGLTDAEEARFIRRGRPGTLKDDPVFSRNPDVIAAIEAPADWSYKRTTQLMDFLEESYIFVLGFPQGRYGYVDIWIRKDRIREVLLTKDQFILEGLDED